MYYVALSEVEKLLAAAQRRVISNGNADASAARAQCA
jgi:hypothetical protein